MCPDRCAASCLRPAGCCHPLQLIWHISALSLGLTFSLPPLPPSLHDSHGGGKFESWQLQWRGLVSGLEKRRGEGTREEWRRRKAGVITQSIKENKQGQREREKWNWRCCLLLLGDGEMWWGDRKRGEMHRGDQQERQEVCILRGQPRRKQTNLLVYSLCVSVQGQIIKEVSL